MIAHFRSGVAILMLVVISSCFSTKMNERAAWLSNDKIIGTLRPINTLTMLTLSQPKDRTLYHAIAVGLQNRLLPTGIASNMLFYEATETIASARTKAGNELKETVLWLLSMKAVTMADEMNNPILQRQIEFIIETKTGERLAAGLISIDRETTEKKLAETIAGIVFGYFKKHKLVGEG